MRQSHICMLLCVCDTERAVAVPYSLYNKNKYEATNETEYLLILASLHGNAEIQKQGINKTWNYV